MFVQPIICQFITSSQDEENSRFKSRIYLMLRSARRARLEARTSA
jgi:hypothetical protein